MKIFKYVTVLLAAVAMTVMFESCDKDSDITGNPMADHNTSVDGKQDFWIDFSLSNPGSLSQAAQARFIELRDTTIYGEKLIKIIEHPMYCTQDYAMDNFNKVINLPNDKSDLVQKVMLPTSQFGGANVRDFEVTMTLSKDSMKTTLATHVFKAAEVLN